MSWLLTINSLPFPAQQGGPSKLSIGHGPWLLLESVQALFKRGLVAMGQVRAKDCTDSWAAGWCCASSWAHALALFGCLVQITHMSLTLSRILLFLQPFLEFLAWILVLFVCLRTALPGSELPSGAGQITQPITGCLMSRGRHTVLWHSGKRRAVCLPGQRVKSKRVSALPQQTSACTDHNVDAFAGQFSELSFPSHS